MAKVSCRKHVDLPSYQPLRRRSCAFPSGYPLTPLTCAQPGCKSAVQLWLNPIEEHQYKQGKRIFHDDETFDLIKVDDRGLEFYGPPLILIAVLQLCQYISEALPLSSPLKRLSDWRFTLPKRRVNKH